MSDFIKKAKEEKDINNGAAIVSSRTDGNLTEHHVKNSQLSNKTQTNNESELENKFGNKFKYFDSAEEIQKIQTRGGGVNKTLAQIQSSLSVIKEKSETIIAKAEKDKDFNSGGAVSNAGGGSKFSDTLETNLSKKDQSDTATVLNENIGSSVKTGSNSGSQDAANIRQEIVNNDNAVAIADTTTDSEGLENGGCPDAQTRGSSRLLPNLIDIKLTDENGDFDPSIAMFGYTSCDCYVPLNLPLLSALGKLAKIPGRMAPHIVKLFNKGNTFEGTLQHIGQWFKYKFASRKAVLEADYIEIDGVMKSLNSAQTTFRSRIVNLNGKVGEIQDNIKLDTSKFDKAKADFGMYRERIAREQKRLDHFNYEPSFFGTPPPGWTACFELKQRLEKLKADAAVGAIDFKTALDNNQALLITKKLELEDVRDSLAAAVKTENDNVAGTLLSDTMGVVGSVAGYPFEVLAAIDPSRKKICIGPGTILNEKTCACECLPDHELCGGGDPLTPAWSLADFVAPVQSDEVRRCYPPCDCNMKRTSGGAILANCECTTCRDGYTWYAGATCNCEKPTGFVATPGGGSVVVPRTTERGTCVQNEKVSSNTSLGKTWDSKGCGFKCGPNTDVGNKDRPFGTHHRLSDNLKTEDNPDGISPSRHHALYAQGCTYVCDGRDRPEGTPWPPYCGDRNVFNTEKCECVPTNCPFYGTHFSGHDPLILQNINHNVDPDTGEPLDYDNFYTITEYRYGGSKLGSPFMGGVTITDPGGDWAIYTDHAGAGGYEFQADPRRYVEWNSSRLRFKAFECNQDGTLGSEITGSVLDLQNSNEYEECYQETWGENPRDPPVLSESDTWLGCLSLNYGVAGASSVDPDIIP